MTAKATAMPALRCVGVLGGMGPEATIMFMGRVLDRISATDDADHIPLLVDQNPQVPSRIRALIEGTGDDPAPVLCAMAARLEKAGATALVMPCTTAHLYAAAIATSVSIPFLSMVDLTAHALALRYPRAKVGMLVSPAVKQTHIFDAALAAQDLSPVYADDQEDLLDAIRRLKRDAADSVARSAVSCATRHLRDRGATIILVGCSEFSLLADRISGDGPVIDSVDVLVDATIAFSRDEEWLTSQSPKAARRPGAPTPHNDTGRRTREAAE